MYFYNTRRDNKYLWEIKEVKFQINIEVLTRRLDKLSMKKTNFLNAVLLT